MIEFLRKFGTRGIKSGRDNSIIFTQIYKFTIIYFNFVLCWGSVVMFMTSLIKLTTSAQSIYKKVMP